MFLCFNGDIISISKAKSFQASFDDRNTLTAIDFPSERTPLYTRLLPPFPIKFSAKEYKIISSYYNMNKTQFAYLRYIMCRVFVYLLSAGFSVRAEHGSDMLVCIKIEEDHNKKQFQPEEN